MSMSGAALATALFAAPMLAVPTITKASTTFHSGVNLSVAPGGANSSSEPLDVQQATNVQRVDEVADIGFDFVRLRVALAPWTDTGSTADQQTALALANGIIQQALGYGMRVDVVMMAGSLPTTTAAGLICTADPTAAAAWATGWRTVLALLPDSANVAFEPLNEPPNCAVGDQVWDAAQFSLYRQFRALRHAVNFVVYGHHWATTSEPTSPRSIQLPILATPMSYSRSITTTRSCLRGKGSPGCSMAGTAT